MYDLSAMADEAKCRHAIPGRQKWLGFVRLILLILQTPFVLLAFVALALAAPRWVFWNADRLCLLTSLAACMGALCFVLSRRKRFVSQRRVPLGVWLVSLLLVALMAAAGLRDAGRTSADGIAGFDQAVYVGAAFAAQRLGWPSPGAVLGSLVSGAHKEDNQHPLYLWLLSAVMQDRVRSYYVGQLTTLALACVTPGVAFVVVGKTYGIGTGAIAALLLATNRTLIRHSCVLNCEGLLVLGLSLAWYFSIKGFAMRGAAASERVLRMRQGRAWLCAGAFTGLAWLAKGSAAFFIAPFVFANWAAYGVRAFRRRGFWLYFVGFVVLSWPLLIRNTRVYGWPLHNWNTPRMWLDGAKEATRWGSDTSGLGPLFYLERHGLGGMWTRLIRGVRAQARSLWMGVSVRLMKHRVVHGGVVLGVGLIALLLDPNRARAVYNLSCVGVFFAFFSWYDLARAGRFTLPVLPIIYTGFGLGSMGAVRALASVRLKKHATSAAVLACACLALVLALYLSAPVRKPTGASWPIAKVFEQMRQAPDLTLREHIRRVCR